MELRKITRGGIEDIVSMSKRAFETDVNVGGAPGDCPPEYDNIEWHEQMAREGHLFSAGYGEKPIGAAILFYDGEKKSLYVGRIFIDSPYHRRGCGTELMNCVEALYPDVKKIFLDTPEWNIRTNSFYRKLGYTAEKTEDGLVYYRKVTE